MIATIDPNMPVWDKYVLLNAGIRITKYNFESCKDGYEKILRFYHEKEMSGEADKLIEIFDKHLPECKDKITRVKKMDLLFWQKRKA